jgi:hypothetical protein
VFAACIGEAKTAQIEVGASMTANVDLSSSSPTTGHTSLPKRPINPIARANNAATTYRPDRHTSPATKPGVTATNAQPCSLPWLSGKGVTSAGF